MTSPPLANRCKECGRKRTIPETVADVDAKTSLWLVDHGAEIGWTDAARAALKARICATCGCAIDKRRRFYKGGDR